MVEIVVRNGPQDADALSQGLRAVLCHTSASFDEQLDVITDLFIRVMACRAEARSAKDVKKETEEYFRHIFNEPTAMAQIDRLIKDIGGTYFKEVIVVGGKHDK